MSREESGNQTERNPRNVDEIYSIYVYVLDDGQFAATETGVDIEARGETRSKAIANYALAIENKAEQSADSPEVNASA